MPIRQHNRPRNLKQSGWHQIATVLLFSLLIVGCGRDSDSKAKQQNQGTVESTSLTSSTGSSSQEASSLSGSSGKTQPAVADSPFTNRKLVDLNGQTLTEHDLHGFVSLVLEVTTQAEAEQLLNEFQALAGDVWKSEKANYSQVVLLVPTEIDAGDLTIKQDANLAVWNFSSRNDSSPSNAKLFVVDPLGVVQAFLDVDENLPRREIDEAIALIWRQQVPFLPEVFESAWMQNRQASQLETASSVPVVHDFKFTDVRRESGIQFLHQIVDDAAIDYKGVHYDHGSGVSIADVDADGFMDIYFVNQQGPSALYRNLGNGTFEDITASAGVAIGDRITVAASFADIDNDSDSDLYVTSVRGGNLLFLNDGSGRFQEVSADYHVDYQGHSSASVFFDYDRDGFLDLLVCNVGQYTTDTKGRGGYFVGFKDAFSGHLKPERAEVSRLYRNLGGQDFEDVTADMGLEDPSWTGDAAFLDVNNDGWLDLYLLDMQGNDEYFENQAGKSFVRKSRDAFPMTPWGAMGVSVRDFDNDLDLDLFITDMHSDMSNDILADVRSEASMSTFFTEEKRKARMQLPESLLKSEGASLYGNALFLNDGPSKYVERSEVANAENYWPWGLSSADFNADGFEDVFITASMNYPFRYGINSLLLNDGTKFHDAEFITGVEPRAGNRTAQPWIQFDTASAEGTLLEKAADGQTGIITVWGSRGSRASVVFDLDQDGDLDIITGEFNDRPLVLKSNLTDQHDVHWVTIELEGDAPQKWNSAQPPTDDSGQSRVNRNAIGARLIVQSGDQKWLKYHDGKTGYLAQGIPRIYCGLGTATAVDSVTVEWPDGTTSIHEGPWETGTHIAIRQTR